MVNHQCDLECFVSKHNVATDRYILNCKTYHFIPSLELKRLKKKFDLVLKFLNQGVFLYICKIQTQCYDCNLFAKRTLQMVSALLFHMKQ